MKHLEFVTSLARDLRIIEGIAFELIAQLIRDVESLRDSNGEYSLWNMAEDRVEYWGKKEWYIEHPLQPVLDYWHSSGFQNFARDCTMTNYEKGLLRKSLKGEEEYHDDWFLYNLENSYLEKDPEVVGIWNAVGYVLERYKQYTAGSNWFKKNWYHDTLTREEYLQLLAKPAGFNGEEYTQNWDKSSKVEFDLPTSFSTNYYDEDIENKVEFPFDYPEFCCYIKSYQWNESMEGFVCEVWTYREDIAAGRGIYDLNAKSWTFIGKDCRHHIRRK